MSEILAPAGGFDSALAAINNGADAIYLGLERFSARNSAENFNEEDFKKVIKIAHAFGVKVYVAMNTMVKNAETSEFLNSAVFAWNCGADAIIISDVFLGAYLKKHCPQICLHLSTQAGVCNVYGAEFAKSLGFDRIVLARETALDDIAEISKIIETEVFVQGALCTCFSGQCYFSSFAGGNSGNRGRCKQPCRKRYKIDRQGFEDGAYALSLSDLSLGEDIEKLKAAGVFSFKIEGRMRRPEYVAAAVKYYKNLLDEKADANDLSDLKRAYNRGNYTKGLAFGQDKNFISSAVQGHIGEFVGTIKVENGKFIVKSLQNFNSGDGFKILREGKEVGGAFFGAKVKGGITLNSRERLKNGDKVFVTTDTATNSRLLGAERKITLNISARFLKGQKAKITVNGITYNGEKVLEKADNRPFEREDFVACFKKTDKFPFEIVFGEVETDGVFVPVSDLNALRRRIFSEYFETISQNKNFQITRVFDGAQQRLKNENNLKTAVICDNLNGISADIGILKPQNYDKTDLYEFVKNFRGEKFLYLPPYLTGKEVQSLKPVVQEFDGIYCDGIYGFKLSEEVGLPLFVGTGINLSNAIAVSACKAKYFALSKELTAKEAGELSSKNSFCLTAGGIKVMDLIYCPFEKKCKNCDKRCCYSLTDENDRKFLLRRYVVGGNCRFEVYNCAPLVADYAPNGVLLDCASEKNAVEIVKAGRDVKRLKQIFGENFTRGHSIKPID